MSVLVVAALASLVGSAAPIDVSSQGEVGLELRHFNDDGVALTEPGNVAGRGRLEVDAQAGAVAAKARIFGRLDAYDDERSAIYPEELFFQVRAHPFRLRLGYQVLNWTATEAFHPADVVNSRYLDSTLENADKLGELMGQAQMRVFSGVAEAFVAPRFISPIFPSSRSPLSLGGPGAVLGGPLRVRHDGEVADNEWALQWGLRVAQTFGSADISLQFIEHLNRDQPLVIFDAARQRFRPVFQPARQFGLTYSQALGSVLLKAEGAHRDYLEPQGGYQDSFGPLPDRDQLHAALGVEVLVPFETGRELALLLEGQVVEEVGAQTPGFYLPPLFQRDALVGFRHAWNDESSRSLTVTAIVDMEDPEQWLANASYSQRLGETWSAVLGARGIWIPPEDPSAPQAFEFWNDVFYGYTTLVRHF